MRNIKSNLWVSISYLLFSVSILLLIGGAETYAQDASGSAAAKYKISFPISTLGNCENLTSCKEYCEDSTHKEACENFAKSKGFYKAPSGQGNVRSKLLLERAKVELGCVSEEACKEFCKDEANQQKCGEFAKKYNLEGPKKAATAAILEKARAALGCTSEGTCKEICKAEANLEKCSYFAKQVGLSGGLIKIASMSGKNQQGLEQIKKMMERCKDNPEYCQKNIATIEAELTKKSNEFCKANPSKCKEIEKEMKQASDQTKVIKEKLKPKPASGSAEKIYPLEPIKIGEPKVQGVSTSLSVFERVWQFIFN